MGAFSTLLAISVKATPSNRPGEYEIGLALVAGCTLAAVWLGLMAARGVRIDGSGIVLRYCIKRRRPSLDSVRCFRMAEVRNPFGERVERAVIELRDGQLVLAPGLEPPMPFIRSSLRGRRPRSEPTPRTTPPRILMQRRRRSTPVRSMS